VVVVSQKGRSLQATFLSRIGSAREQIDKRPKLREHLLLGSDRQLQSLGYL
jgi:hypothetical protein